MTGRIHPATMNDLGIRTDGDVLGDNTEPRTSFGEAVFEIGFAGESVLEPIQVEHEKGVLAGGFEECFIPLKCGEAVGSALAVQSFEELALRVVPLQLSMRAGRKTEQKCNGQEKYEITHADEISRGRGRR